MGDDSVIECVYENGMVTAYTSITTRGEGNYGANRAPVVCLSRCFCTYFKLIFPVGSKYYHIEEFNDGKWSNLLSS